MARKSSEARDIAAERNTARRMRTFQRSTQRRDKADARARFGGQR